MRFIQITLGLSLLVSGCTAMAPVTTEATAPTFVDYRGLSLRLKPGMSEQNVIDLYFGDKRDWRELWGQSNVSARAGTTSVD